VSVLFLNVSSLVVDRIQIGDNLMNLLENRGLQDNLNIIYIQQKELAYDG
jgi:hypothetical protein